MNLQSILRDIIEIADHHADVDDGQPNDWMRVKVLAESGVKMNSLGDVKIPKELSGMDFANAWARWCKYRTERKLSVYKPMGLQAQWTRLAEMGLQRAIAAINYSITQNYQGIYEERQGSHSANTRPSEVIGGTQQYGLGPGIHGGKRP